MTDQPIPSGALGDAQARFARGDFLGARLAAERVLAGGSAGDQPADRPADQPADQPADDAAARDLLARLDADPWALRFGLAILAVLALVAGLYVR
jgi:hypothetical protein